MAAEEVFVLDPLDRPVYGARDIGRVVGLTPPGRHMKRWSTATCLAINLARSGSPLRDD